MRSALPELTLLLFQFPVLPLILLAFARVDALAVGAVLVCMVIDSEFDDSNCGDLRLDSLEARFTSSDLSILGVSVVADMLIRFVADVAIGVVGCGEV